MSVALDNLFGAWYSVENRELPRQEKGEIKMSIMDISITNLNGVANQFIILSKFGTMFQSYNSPIVLIDWINDEITIYPDYKNSATTSRHRNMFFERRGMIELASTKGLEKCLKNGCWQDFQVIKMGD